MSPVQFLASKFPGKTEQEYRSHLGNFQITGMTGLQTIATLSGGQKSRVAFAVLSLQRPHVLLLDEARCFQTTLSAPLTILFYSRLITWISKSVLRIPAWLYIYALFIFRWPSPPIGSGCTNARAENMERWGHHHLSRRKVYYISCGRGRPTLT